LFVRSAKNIEGSTAKEEDDASIPELLDMEPWLEGISEEVDEAREDDNKLKPRDA